MRKKLTTTLFTCCVVCTLYAQITPPYYTNFDTPTDTIGWSHHATGFNHSDDWEWGVPNGTYIDEASSTPHAWVTTLEGDCNNTDRFLQTPSFDLSYIEDNFVFIFHQKRHSNNSNSDYFVDYSINNSNWLRLYDSDELYTSWQGYFGFFGNVYHYSEVSYTNLSFLSGHDNVRFRFRFKNVNTSGEGWMIDNFGIIEAQGFNFYPRNDDTIRYASRFCRDHEAEISLGIFNHYANFDANVTTNYYFSDDPYLDTNDEFITSITRDLSQGNYWNIDVTLPENLPSGNFYILYEMDALNEVDETDETDNVGVVVVPIQAVHETPYFDDFEGDKPMWDFYLRNFNSYPIWELGNSYRHRINGTRSGENAWHTSKTIEYDITCNHEQCQNQYIESPLIGLDDGANIIHFWVKKTVYDYSQIEYSLDCGRTWEETNDYFPLSENGEWNTFGFSLPNIDNIKIRVKYKGSYLDPEGLAIDDFYIGPPKPDLTIEGNKNNRYTSSASSTQKLSYHLWNSWGTAPQFNTRFYWSNDSIFDNSDILIGTNTESAGLEDKVWRDITFTKPTTASGKYYILYEVDSNNEVDEMREVNNFGHFILYQQTYKNTPYFNDFETEIDGWRHNATLANDDWQWTTPKGEQLSEAFSGEKVWITKDTGIVSEMSRMHLYTPVFDFSNAETPVIEFDMKLLGSGGCHCFHGTLNMSYSTDGGVSWIVLDTTSTSYTRWYYTKEFHAGIDRNYQNPNYTELMFDAYSERSFATLSQYNGRDTRRNTRYVLDIAFLAGESDVQFRYNFATLKGREIAASIVLDAEGVMIDNFSIREAFVDLNVDDDKKLLISPQSNKIPFFIQIKNQGNYISEPGAVRFYLSQDTQLDAADTYLGQEDIGAIQPDMYYYINVAYDALANLSDHQYLLYDLDVDNTNNESNENNNLGYWELAMEGIANYPYYNDFQDTIVDGWYQYSTTPNGASMKNYRMRTVIAPGEPLYSSNVQSGYWFNEPLNNWESSYLIFHLQSPKFDFSNVVDSIRLSFNLYCDGINNFWQGDGGNLEYSTNGGNTWTVLTEEDRSAQNWYTESDIEYLNEQPGWAYIESHAPDAPLRPVYIDITDFRGEPDVTFRFKYATWEFFHGFRMDNFNIQAESIYTSTDEPPTSFESAIDMYVNDRILYISAQNQDKELYTMSIVSVNGQLIHQTDVNIESGINQFRLPENLASGMYFIHLNNGYHMVTEKALILR